LIQNCFYYRLQDDTLVGSGHGNVVRVGPGERFTLECNSGSERYIDFPVAHDRAKIEFSFLYTEGNSIFPKKAEGEIIANVQEQVCGVNRCMYPGEVSC
jgi:hypothetical protein